MWLIHFGGFSFVKIWKNMEKRPKKGQFSGLGKYRIGGYGRIGYTAKTKNK